MSGTERRLVVKKLLFTLALICCLIACTTTSTHVSTDLNPNPSPAPIPSESAEPSEQESEASIPLEEPSESPESSEEESMEEESSPQEPIPEQSEGREEPKEESSMELMGYSGEIEIPVVIYERPEDFLEDMVGIVMDRDDLPLFPSVIIAHAYSESGAGGFFGGLYRKTNNCFGIRAGSGWDGAVYCRDNGKVYYSYRHAAKHGKDLFRAYDSIDESLDDYIKVISQDRYREARDAINPEGAIKALADCGYFDPGYCESIAFIIRRFGLKDKDIKYGQKGT